MNDRVLFFVGLARRFSMANARIDRFIPTARVDDSFAFLVHSSWLALCQPSTPFFAPSDEGVDGWDEPSHDDVERSVYRAVGIRSESATISPLKAATHLSE